MFYRILLYIYTVIQVKMELSMIYVNDTNNGTTFNYDNTSSNINTILKQVKKYNDEKRWILFITNDLKINKKKLFEEGINLDKVIVFNNFNEHDNDLIICKAIKEGNCSSIIIDNILTKEADYVINYYSMIKKTDVLKLH